MNFYFYFFCIYANYIALSVRYVFSSISLHVFFDDNQLNDCSTGYFKTGCKSSHNFLMVFKFKTW